MNNENAFAPGGVCMAYIPYMDTAAAPGTLRGGVHPCLIISTQRSCDMLNCLTVVPGTSNVDKPAYPTHYEVSPDGQNGLERATRFKCEGAVSIPNTAVREIIGRITKRQYMDMQDHLFAAIHTEKSDW